MEPLYRDEALTVWQGDCRTVLASLPAESVHAVVTSPPYWGLRDYGTASWSGGEPGHAHEGMVQRTPPPGSAKQASKRGSTNVRSGDCACGAVRIDAQIGLEPSLEAYIDTMVGVFREIRRVLRRDGSVWLNLGDSYVAAQGGRQSAVGELPGGVLRRDASPDQRAVGSRKPTSWAHRDATVKTTPARGTSALKPKDLAGVPWRVAFALQDDGWWLRRDVIWSKPNPMPESAEDRPTSSHEYLFLLTRQPRYFYDGWAVREQSIDPEQARWDPGTGGLGGADRLTGSTTRRFGADAGARRLRSVWSIPTEPYKGAHFATFPKALVVPCILASTSERGVCPECGAPWVRELDVVPTEATRKTYRGAEAGAVARHRGLPERPGGFLNGSETTAGWSPSCRHGGEPDDLEVIRTPTGEGMGGDFHRARTRVGRGGPVTARRGLDRGRRDDEGVRIMYRWQQRDLARQIRALLPVTIEVMRLEAAEAGYGPDAMEHWMRTDRSGGRAIPAPLLERWLEAGLLLWPLGDPAVASDPVPATVLDPFAGSGTTGFVAQSLGRRAVLIDLSGDYLVQALERNAQMGLLLSVASTVAADVHRELRLAADVSVAFDTTPLPLFESEVGS